MRWAAGLPWQGNMLIDKVIITMVSFIVYHLPPSVLTAGPAISPILQIQKQKFNHLAKVTVMEEQCLDLSPDELAPLY